MVVFTCNNCGESLKKQVVEKHYSFMCKSKHVSVSCMDCFKDFDETTYDKHVQCITELERYSGKDYVAKPNQNKGQKKQEAWVDLVRSITDKKKMIPNGVKKILETISGFDNIPRKKAKFLNYMRNSFRYMKVDELEQAWTLLEEAMNEKKEENAKQQQNGTSNGNHQEETIGDVKTDETNGKTKEKSKKRKLEETNDDEVEDTKMSKVEEIVEEEPETTEKFNFKESIRNYLTTKVKGKKKKEVKLSKLKGKIMKKYKVFTGSEWSDKIEGKFNKKMNKLKGIVVENDRVRLLRRQPSDE